MRTDSPARRAVVVVGAFAVAVVAMPLLLAQAPAPPPSNGGATSKAQAKELGELLASRKLEAFGMRDSTDAARFIAVFHIPGVQFLVVAANYERPTDMEYRLYTKDYMGLYQDLNGSTLAKSKVFVEDALCDGLNPTPKPDQGRDSVTSGAERRVFDGDFADPKRRNQNQNQKKISQEDYLKAFSAADEQYCKLLAQLVEALKKSGL